MAVALAVWPWELFTSWFELVYPPDMTFRLTIVGLGFVNFLLSMFIEYFLIENLLFRRLRYRFHNIEKSRRKFLSIENHLRQTPSWPPISPMYPADGGGGGGGVGGGSASTPTSPLATVTHNSEEDHQSPKSFTEICVESDMTTLNNCNSVLKGFFDHLDSECESEGSSGSESDYESDGHEIQQNIQTNGIKPPIAISENNVIDNSDKENQNSPSLSNSNETSSSNESTIFLTNNGHSPADTNKSFTNHIQSNHCDNLTNNTQINQILATSNS